MKIALINSRLGHFGGLETRLLNYIDHFTSQGHEVTVICYKTDQSIVLPENSRVIKLKVRWSPRKFRRDLFNILVDRYMRKHNFDFSLSLGRTTTQDAVLAPSNHLGYLRAIGKKSQGYGDRQQIRLDRESYNKSKLVFACSDMIKTELKELYQTDTDKIKVLFPPLDTNKFNFFLQTKRKELRNEFGIKENEKAFVFVSTGHKRKGLDLLMEVFEKLEGTNNHLYIAGSPVVKPNTSNIKYLGFVKQTNTLYTAADFTIHPAKYEPFGQVITESLACGTPVIISHKVGAREIITPELGLVMGNFEINNWKSAIEKLERDNFKIPKNLVAENNLSTSSHIAKMMEYWQNANSVS